MAASLAWREAAIARDHERESFDCGVAALNEYLRRYARQNHESGGVKTFVAVPRDDARRVLAYYSIGPGSIEFARLPASLTKRLGRYELPVFRLARLAVDRTAQGRGLGADLLLAAGCRALSAAAEIGGLALAIDAKDERAVVWYERFGAMRLRDDPLRLILPLTTIADTLAAAR